MKTSSHSGIWTGKRSFILFSTLFILFAVLPLIAQNDSNYALKYDGIDDYIEIPYDNVLSQYTIEAWVKIFKIKDSNIIVSTNSSGPHSSWSNQLRIRDGKFEHYLWDGSSHELRGTTEIQIGIWYHVAGLAQNNGTMRLFVDGIEEGQSQNIGQFESGDRYLIGASTGNSMDYYEGLIDEVRISDTLRYSSNFTIPTIPFTEDENTIGLFHFEDGSGQVAINSISSGVHDGRLGSTNEEDINDPNWKSPKLMPALILLKPTDNSAVIGEVTFEWEAGIEVQNYHIQVSSDTNFISLLWNKDDISSSQTSIVYSGDPLSPGEGYYWRVSYTTNNSEYSEWSEIWRFTYLEEYSGATLIDENFDSEIDNFTLNGNAILEQNSIRLTLNQGDQGGSLFYDDAMILYDFEVTFDAYFGSNTGGADGICFVWQTNSTDVIGELGGGMAYKNIDSSYAVEFDTYYNSQFSDPDDNHIGVDQNGSVVSVTENRNIITLEDDSWHNVRIRQDNGHIYVWLDNESDINYTISDYISGCAYYYGFTGATGNANNVQRIDNFILKGTQTDSLSLLTPQNGSTVNTPEVNFQWSETNALYYILYVDDDADFSSPEISDQHPLGAFDNHDYKQTSYQICGNWLTAGIQYWKVRAYYEGGSYSESEVWQFTYTPPIEPQPVWFPLYRMYKGEDHDHFYVINDNNRQIAINSGYHDERVEGYLSIKPFDDTDMVSLYRFYDADRGCHFYTTNQTTKDDSIQAGLTYEGITGYAYGTSHDGLEELYSLKKVYSSADHDNFYTISEFEKDNAISAYDFKLKEIAAYVSPIGYDEKILLNAAQLLVGMGMNAVNGNFSHYTKTTFNIPSIGMPLVFEHIYNSLIVPNNSGRLPLGPGWSHSYNSYIDLAYGNNQVAVIWPDGNLDEYNKAGNVYTPVYKGVYDTLIFINDKKFEVKRKDQIVFTFEVPADTGNGYPAVLTSIKDRNSNTITCDYEPGGLRRLTSITGPAGRQLEFSYYSQPGKESLLERVSDPINRDIKFNYNSDGILTSFTDASNGITEYAYDDSSYYDHMLQKITLPRGNIIDNTYDEKKLNSQNVSNLGALSFAMNPNQTTITNAQDKKLDVYTTEYGGYQVIDRVVDGLGYETDPEFTDPDNPTKPRTVTDKNGNVTEYIYDGRGNILEIRQPMGVTHKFTYDAQNNLLKYTDPRDKETDYSYDGNGNLISTTDPLSHSVNLSRLSTGLIESISNPLSHVTYFTYNQYGNVETVHDPLSNTTTYNYDDVSRMTQSTNAKSQATSYTYTNSDLIATITDAANGLTSYSYDANDNLEAVSDAKSQTTTWAYNNLDLVTSISNPLGNQKGYNYNSDGTLNSRTNPDGGQTSYTYDDALRVTGISSLNASIGYDANSNIKNATTDGRSLTFNYDALNRMIDYTDAYGHIIKYTYDANSNITSIEYQPGKVVTYTYYDDNRLNTVTDWNGNATSYTYRADGTLNEINYANGVHSIYSYDVADRLTGITISKSGGEVIASYTYTLDELGNITATAATEPLSMPALDEKNISLNYDAANRLQSAGSDIYSFNVNGNLINKNSGSLKFTFDSENRLTNIGGSDTASYVYDLFGNRRSATRNGVTRRYALDINGPMSQVLFETDENNNVINYYIYGLGLVSRIKANGTTHYYHYNNIGNVAAMTDQSQNVTHKYIYDPFGEIVANEEADANPFRFVGQFGVMDEGNGLFFMRARYYDFDVGRFISEDPIWDENLYRYAGNNSISNIDPMGSDFSEAFVHYGTKFVDVGEKFMSYLRAKTEAFAPSEKLKKDASIEDISNRVKFGEEDTIVGMISIGYNIYYDTLKDKETTWNLRNFYSTENLRLIGNNFKQTNKAIYGVERFGN